MRRPENGFRILTRVAEELKDVAEVTDRPGKMLGRDLPMVLSPLAGFKTPAKESQPARAVAKPAEKKADS